MSGFISCAASRGGAQCQGHHEVHRGKRPAVGENQDQGAGCVFDALESAGHRRAHDAVAFAAKQVEIELNGVGDNPIFLPEANLTLTGANFQGTPVSLPWT